MSRFLFVVAPLAGHLNPAVALSRALVELGHEPAWVGPETLLRPRVGPDAVVVPTGMRPYRGQRDRGMRAVKSLWEGFLVPFARAILPAVDQAVRQVRPDVVVADQHAFAGALAAYRHGLPWASLATSMMELTQPYRAFPKVDAWMRAKMSGLWREAGLPAGAGAELRFSPYLALANTTAALTGPVAFPDHYALVGQMLGERPAMPDFPWHRLDAGRRLVLVTTGTLAADLSADFFQRAVAALAPLAGTVQMVCSTDPATVPDPPGDAVILPRVPVLELMPMVSAVVSHGGSTTREALAHGVPVVVAPIRHDQPVLAAQVAAAGAGIRVSFGRASPHRLRAAGRAVLEEPGYRAAAGRIRDSFVAAGGARAAAQRLDALARR